MADSLVRVPLKDSSLTPQTTYADAAERRLRQWGAWIILVLLLQGELGLAWDRQWHDLVGRDQFWIPPHIMLYSGLGGAGLAALCIVLLESVRYAQHKAGVDDTSTTVVLRIFHAPLGFILLGFGALTDLLAAPFDNYWHQLYGIDVTLWSPFHIMGTIGGVIAGIGSIFIFASEAAYERERESRRFLGLNGPEWGAIVLIAAIIELTLPALTAFTPVSIGSLVIPTFPLILVFAGSGGIAAITRLTHKPGSATLVGCIVWLECVLTQAFIPQALNFVVPRYGQTFRFANRLPHFNLTLALIPLLFVVCGILVDILNYRRRNSKMFESFRWLWLPCIAVAVCAVFVPPAIAHLLLMTHTVYVQPDVVKVLAIDWQDMVLGVLPAIIVSIGSAMLGAFFGDIFYRSKI